MITNRFINPLLTDKYQLTQAYAYWKAGRHEIPATFDLFFRRCPFKGEFAIMGGLFNAIALLENFHFRGERMDMVRKVLSGCGCEAEFYEWLAGLDASGVIVEAIPEGSVVFGREPLITVTGPLAVGQLLETPLLNLINYATLVATNAARFRLAAGSEKSLLEFGLRRAQGPDGAMSASRYAYIGGFNATSNVLASVLYDIPCEGTHAHAFVQSFTGLGDLRKTTIATIDGSEAEFVEVVLGFRKSLAEKGIIPTEATNNGELAAFIAYAQAFPDKFLALVDTYDTLKSGIPNFLAVSLALHQCGHKPLGIRLDSGDLAYLSLEARARFKLVANEFGWVTCCYFRDFTIVASNDINEEVLWALRQQGHEIDVFGVGTNLVTCQAQPALGGVYKLVEVNGVSRIKLSEDSGKLTWPGRKRTYRLYNNDLKPAVDLVALAGELAPVVGQPVLCLHPFDATARTTITPRGVELLQRRIWNGHPLNSDCWCPAERSKGRAVSQLQAMRRDYLRPINPTPYKVSVSVALYDELHRLLNEARSFE